MKSKTQQARAILYNKFNDNEIHTKSDFQIEITKTLQTTQEWADKWLDIFTQNQEIEWLGNGRFVVRGSPTQLTLGDV